MRTNPGGEEGTGAIPMAKIRSVRTLKYRTRTYLPAQDVCNPHFMVVND